MSREKLKDIGIRLPLLPVSLHEGLPKPKSLRGVLPRDRGGEATASQIRSARERATAFWVKTQEELGVDVIVDGTQYCGDLPAHFATQLSGMKLGDWVPCFENRRVRSYIVEGPVRWREPITVHWWEFAASLTRKPVKGIVMGPYTLATTTLISYGPYYYDRGAFYNDLLQAVASEIDALISAGCRIIQVNEHMILARPRELQTALDGLKALMEGRNAYFSVALWYADYRGYGTIFPGILETAADNIHFEMANSGLSILRIFREFPPERDISAGVVDSLWEEVETSDIVRQRVTDLLRVIPKERLWLGPDSVLRGLSVDNAIAKIRVLVEAASYGRSAG